MNDLHDSINCAPEYAEVDGIKSINDDGGDNDVNGTSAYATTNLMGGDYNGGGGSSSLEGRNRSVSAAVSVLEALTFPDFGAVFLSIFYNELGFLQ